MLTTLKVTDCLCEEGVDGAGCVHSEGSLSVGIDPICFEEVWVSGLEELSQTYNTHNYSKCSRI